MRKLLVILRAVSGEVGRDEILILVALALLAYGFWPVWPPASFLIPGATLLWLALPARLPFIARAQVPEKLSRRKR